MHRSKRRSAARLAGWAIVLTLYGSGVLFAADLAAGSSTTDGPAVPAPTVSAQQVAVADAESPVVTLILAVGSIAGVAAVRAVRSARRRERPVILRPASRRVSSPT